MIDLHERMLLASAGVEPATSWTPVGRGIQLSHRGDLVFDPKWHSFELDLEIIKANILSNIHDDCFKNVTSRVLTSFSFDLTW